MALPELPPLPAEGENPWYEKRQAWDEAVGEALERISLLQEINLESLVDPTRLVLDGSVDMAPVLQEALEAAAALTETRGPLTIRLPAGRFQVASHVRWRTGYHVGFVGAGRANTRLLVTGNALFGLIDPGFDITTTLDDLIFADFTIDCTAQVSGPNNVGAKAIALRYMVRGLFYRVRAINSWATSFGCDFLQDTYFVDCTVVGSGQGVTGGHDSFGAGFGIGVGEFENETVTFINCHAFGSHSGGFFFERLLEVESPEDSPGQLMIGCTSRGSYNGIRDAGARGLQVVGGDFSDNTNAGLHIEGYPRNGRHGGWDGMIANATFTNNGRGVLVGNASGGGYTFNGCTISDNDEEGVRTTGQIGPGYSFQGCRIERNGSGGIVFASPLTGRPRIVDSVIRGNGDGPGVEITGDTYEPFVVGNTIQGHVGAGISLPGVSQTLVDPVIRNNVITENAEGSIRNDKATQDATFIADNRSTPAFTTVTNLVTNPSFELDISDVVVVNRFGTPVQGTDQPKFGTKYAELTANAAGSATARVGRVSGSISGTYTASVWARAPKHTILRPFAVGYWASNASLRPYQAGGVRATGYWQRLSVTIPLPANGSRIDINVSLDNAKVGDKIAIDGVDLTPGTMLWPHIDGDQPECVWNGTSHASTASWTVGEAPEQTLAEQLEGATSSTPLAVAFGSTITTGLSIPAAQELTLYSVYESAPAAGARSALRAGDNGDRMGTGRNGGDTAWVAVATDASATPFNVQIPAPAGPSVMSAVRDTSGITLHVQGGEPATTAIGSYDPENLTRLVNDAEVAYGIVYAGAHSSATRQAVMTVLGNWFNV